MIEPLAADQPAAPTPPIAHRDPKITELHGRKLEDDYFWMRDKSNPEVRAYLEAENAYADALMGPTKPLQGKLYDEMLGRIKETDTQAPYREGEFFYYARTEKGRQYPILCRKRGSLDAAEEVTLDVNQLAEGQKFMAIGAYAISDDGRLLAYSTDNTGFRQYTLQVKDLRTGAVLPDMVEKTGSVAWANNNQTLFYTVEDPAKRQYRLYRHSLGAPVSGDQLIYEEKDERFTVRVSKSLSRKFIFLECESHTTTEVRYLPADKADGQWKLMEPRQAGIEYYPDHHGDSFYLRVNDTGRNFRIVKAPVDDPAKAHWQEIVAQRHEVMIEGLQLFRDFLVLQEREDGLQEITITDLHTEKSKRVQLPEPAYTVAPDNNREFDTHQYRYRYTSFITPMSVYDYDMTKQTSTLVKRTEVPGNFEPARYEIKRAFATARDGVRVPISLLYLKSVPRDGTAPVYLYAYGSYGIPSNIAFNSNRFSLVDRGVIFAVAHIRGGGDLGKAWHDDGRMMKKMNTFTDFIACAEYLTAPAAGDGNGGQQLQYGDRHKLIIEGGSAGGLLMGAVTNMRPDLFKAVIAKVPFVDVINTMLDESLPLTVGEFEEWGNPKKKADFEYMVQYSPYDNLRKASYPAMLVKTSFNDSQVMYWEPAKYVARLRTLDTGKNVVLLKTNMGAGHGGASGRYDYLHEIAFDYAFILWQLGIAE
ncbi:MAG: S9 family peptidase [Terriglobales bacterium]